jgi:hypothetical protein
MLTNTFSWIKSISLMQEAIIFLNLLFFSKEPLIGLGVGIWPFLFAHPLVYLLKQASPSMPDIYIYISIGYKFCGIINLHMKFWFKIRLILCLFHSTSNLNIIILCSYTKHGYKTQVDSWLMQIKNKDNN